MRLLPVEQGRVGARHVIARAEESEVVAAVTVHEVVASLTEELVVALTAKYGVVARAAERRVVAGAPSSLAPTSPRDGLAHLRSGCSFRSYRAPD
jgi:hypothetical protein